MRQALVVGNWKMHGSRDSASALISTVVAGSDGIGSTAAICPPLPYLQLAQKLMNGSAVKLGAQNLSEHAPGAYTGEVAGAMLTDFGCTYVIVGHSERRALYGETDAIVARKFAAAQRAGLTPILCVGETLEERDADATESVVERQLRAVLDVSGVAAFENAVVAYEPVWAIGTGKTATPDQAQAVHAFIRARISEQDATIARQTHILYGGSVKASNAADLFGMPDIDGGLVGGASLDGDEFLSICRANG